MLILLIEVILLKFNYFNRLDIDFSLEEQSYIYYTYHFQHC